jgi:serine/threonine protein phosphatase PrpC
MITAPKKGNQDQYTVLPEFGSSDTAFFAVFDGHGKYGDDVSTYCKTNVRLIISYLINMF